MGHGAETNFLHERDYVSRMRNDYIARWPMIASSYEGMLLLGFSWWALARDEWMEWNRCHGHGDATMEWIMDATMDG